MKGRSLLLKVGTHLDVQNVMNESYLTSILTINIVITK